MKRQSPKKTYHWPFLIDNNDRLVDRQNKIEYTDIVVESLYAALKESFYCTPNAPIAYWKSFGEKREEALAAYNLWRNKK